MHDYFKTFPGLSDLRVEWEAETLLYKVMKDNETLKRFTDPFQAAAFIRETHKEELNHA